MSAWQPIGAHRFSARGEVLQFEPHGALSVSEAEAFAADMAAHFQRHPQGFLLVDASDLKPPPAEVRRLFITFFRDHELRPRVVVFGANLLVRTVSRLVLGAARQLHGLTLDLTQYATEAEARAHIEQRRGQ